MKRSGNQSSRSTPGRLKRGPAPELIESANRLEAASGPVLYQGLSLGDIAHVILLTENEVIPQASGKRLLSVLLDAHTIPPDEFPFDPAWGDSYKNRERYLNQQLPDDGGWLRAGRARRDVTNVAYQLTVRQRMLALLGDLVDLMEALTNRIQENVDTLMPDYTYLQQAQPTTFGHYLLGFVYPMLRDAERLRACFGRVNLCPGGIGSVNGSRLPLDRQRLAELLGFDGPVHHTRDAMWQADIAFETASTLVALLINLDRLAEDLQIWVTQEFNLIELDDGYSRTSVIMPQKKNPYSLTYIRGLSNVMIGQLVAMANVGRTPSGQPDNRIFAYGNVPLSLEQTSGAMRLMAGVISTLKLNTPLMAERVSLGYSQATDLADVIMTATGLPYQRAHQVVGQVITTAIEQGIPAQELSVNMIEQAAQQVIGHVINLSAERLAEALDPHAIIATRKGVGGAAREPMSRMIAECSERITEVQTWCDQVKQRLTTAEADLIRLAREMAMPASVASH